MLLCYLHLELDRDRIQCLYVLVQTCPCCVVLPWWPPHWESLPNLKNICSTGLADAICGFPILAWPVPSVRGVMKQLLAYVIYMTQKVEKAERNMTQKVDRNILIQLERAQWWPAWDEPVLKVTTLPLNHRKTLWTGQPPWCMHTAVPKLEFKWSFVVSEQHCWMFESVSCLMTTTGRRQ